MTEKKGGSSSGIGTLISISAASSSFLIAMSAIGRVDWSWWISNYPLFFWVVIIFTLLAIIYIVFTVKSLLK